MAKGAEKRRASSNARTVQTLVYGFLLSNTLYITAQLVRYRSVRWPVGVWAPYLVTETIAAFLAWQLMGMARSGEDLSQPGLTAYVWYCNNQLHVGHGVHYLVRPWHYRPAVSLLLVDLLGGMSSVSYRSLCMHFTSCTRISWRHTCSSATVHRAKRPAQPLPQRPKGRASARPSGRCEADQVAVHSNSQYYELGRRSRATRRRRLGGGRRSDPAGRLLLTLHGQPVRQLQ